MRTGIEAPGRPRSFIEQARRAQITQAAIDTVADVGYSRASLSRIAKRAGISKSVISYHFDGKDDLLTQVMTDFATATESYLRAQLATAGTAAGQIRTWIGAQITYFAQHRAAFLAFSEILANHRDATGERPFLAAASAELDVIAQILTDGQRAGEFRDFDAYEVAVIITRATEGVLASWMADERIDLAAQARTLVDFINHAIAAEEP